MSSDEKYLRLLVVLLLLTFWMNPQGVAQENVAFDWNITRVGDVKQVITNFGHLNAASSDPITGNLYPGLIDCEYPPGSGIDYLDWSGPWFGARKPSGKIAVSVTEAGGIASDLFPTEAKWDTIWVVNKGDTADIPYWPGYTAVSDQDFVCRYNDYQIRNPYNREGQPHTPLFIDVIQKTYSWTNPPLDNVVLWTYHVIPQREQLTDFYFALQFRGAVGPPNASPADDDRSLYFPETHTMVYTDTPGGEDGRIDGGIGFQVIPPRSNMSGEELKWNYLWGDGDMSDRWDEELYRTFMTPGNIMNNQQVPGPTTSWGSVGPYDVNPEDTLTFRLAEILAADLDSIQETATTIDRLKDELIATGRFRRPIAPPVPPMEIGTRSKMVRISWNPTEENNPELYEDPNRGDSLTVDQPFEGYRVYKSMESPNGPWTLLAEYDIAGNWYGENTGLQYSYTDRGLLDNVEYYYTVTAFSKRDTILNWPSVESSLRRNVRQVVPGPETPETVGDVAVVPNPYRGDIPYQSYQPAWEESPPGRPWMEQDRKVQFINLPESCTITIYTAAGDFIANLDHQNADKGYENWNLTSYANQAIASGVYIYVVEDTKNGATQTGKFVVIK